MDAKVSHYLPHVFRSFQGFRTKDLKEFVSESRLEIHLEAEDRHVPLCNACGHTLGAMKDRYFVRAKHSTLR